MTSAENIEDQIANLVAQLIVLHGLERAEEFIGTVALQFAAARAEANVIRIPPRLQVVRNDHA